MLQRIITVFSTLALTVLAALWAAGCGPVESLVVINQANLNIEAAQRSEAERFAPYEYTGAVERIHKAREEMNYSDYEAAIDLALEAKKLAAQAREKAITHPDRTVLPPASDAAPRRTDRLD